MTLAAEGHGRPVSPDDPVMRAERGEVVCHDFDRAGLSSALPFFAIVARMNSRWSTWRRNPWGQ